VRAVVWRWRRFYIVQCPKRQGGKCRLLMTAKHRLPVGFMRRTHGLRNESLRANAAVVQWQALSPAMLGCVKQQSHVQDVNRPGEERTLGLIVRVADTKDQIFKALVGDC
jgi:hypothetical protein